MTIRHRPLTRDEWHIRIVEFLIDIGKETDEFCDEIYELLIDKTLDARDERRDDTPVIEFVPSKRKR